MWLSWSQSGLSFVLPGDRLWDGLGADGNLDALLPLLPPRVGEDVVVLGVQLVRVVHLHGSDQVRPENLQQSHENVSQKNESQNTLLQILRHCHFACGRGFSLIFVFVGTQFPAIRGSQE